MEGMEEGKVIDISDMAVIMQEDAPMSGGVTTQPSKEASKVGDGMDTVPNGFNIRDVPM